jgi:hypothetical protein
MKVRARIFSRPMLVLFIGCPLLVSCMYAGADGPSVPFTGKFGQVEVGGRYAGAEFHGSRPLPSRISFFYPVANSVDLSKDYWKRGDSRPMVVGVAIDGERRHWVGKEGWDYVLSPSRVHFTKSIDGLDYSMSYEFCLNEPGMVFRFVIRNGRGRATRVSAYAHLKATLRTCQTYARLDSASTMTIKNGATLVARYPEREAGMSCLLVGNAGMKPASWTTDANELGIVDSGASRWVDSSLTLRHRLFPNGSPGDAALVFAYEQLVQPGDSMSIIQYIATCKLEEADVVDHRLATGWSKEVQGYNDLVRKQAYEESRIRTGDSWVDSSVFWARAILAANAHYLDGTVVPMPCPAEYNFFFTHDVLLTDLAAINFDPERVRRDLLYIASLAQGNIIPHAYYWRDDGFKTELCTPDNWNHLWFILVNGSYLRHTADTTTASRLYPLITKSLTEILQQRKPDNLMYAYRPDWWDIGHIEGPRSFITILTIRALREYQFISAMLRRNQEKLAEYEQLSDQMQSALVFRLWDDKLGYLINFNGDREDTHYYMGSLLAAQFGLLPVRNARTMLETASRVLVAPNIGVRTVFPVDFNTDSVKGFFKLVDNEAGDPYLYANGGVWPHNNAWYILGLQSTGRMSEAYSFFRQTMTLEGIMHSPMGYPAMYEYRFSDPSSPEYGRIDKPSFLWAGGFYLFTLYHLMGVSESEWNISLGNNVPGEMRSAHYDLWFRGRKSVAQAGAGIEIQQLQADGKRVASRVVPVDLARTRAWELKLGKARGAYLDRVNAIVHSVSLNKGGDVLSAQVSSFDGHKVLVKIVSPLPPMKATVDGQTIGFRLAAPSAGGTQGYEIQFQGKNDSQLLEVSF